MRAYLGGPVGEEPGGEGTAGMRRGQGPGCESATEGDYSGTHGAGVAHRSGGGRSWTVK